MSTQPVSVSTTKKPSLIQRISDYYCIFKHYAARLDSPFLLLVRLYWGWQFAQSGWGRLHNPHAVEFFASLGIPAPGIVEPAVSSLELVGGILLIVGLATRLTGLLLAADMFVAYLTSDRDALRSIISDPGKFYNADPFTFLFASLIVLIFGAGFFSLDYFFSQRRRR
ncbi:MAG TPA: DoxX family protein [Alloacidobacterium sp.]|jgi:putative oxidoreductase|nr:DoxX family protein [Alloacidobacterium sp.]